MPASPPARQLNACRPVPGAFPGPDRRAVVVAILPFAGSARTRGPFNLTMDANDAIETAHAFPDAKIVPIHRDGWAHFTQNAKDLEDRSRRSVSIRGWLLLEPGVPMPITAS